MASDLRKQYDEMVEKLPEMTPEEIATDSYCEETVIVQEGKDWIKGIDEAKKALAVMEKANISITMKNEDVLESGDLLVARGNYTGKDKDSGDVKLQGKYVSVFKLVDGKLKCFIDSITKS